jgi:hypothetical protein
MTEQSRGRIQQVAGCFAAFIFAALCSAFAALMPFGLAASVDQFANLLLLFAFGITLAYAVVLGLPLFLLLWQEGWINAFSSIGGGFLVGIAGTFLLTLGLFDRGLSYSFDGVPHVISGVRTAAGWLSYLRTLIFFGLHGAFAGFVFWCLLKWSGVVVSGRGEATAGGKSRVGTAAGLAAAALLATGTVVALPAATKDRTCHNMFRVARTIAPAVVRIDLAILTDESPRLIQLLQEFGAAHALSFRNSGRDEFGHRRVLSVSLCDELGTNIKAGHDTWAAGVGISIYQVRDRAAATTLAKNLAGKLETQWPEAVRFRDRRGQIISTPQ